MESGRLRVSVVAFRWQPCPDTHSVLPLPTTTCVVGVFDAGLLPWRYSLFTLQPQWVYFKICSL